MSFHEELMKNYSIYLISKTPTVCHKEKSRKRSDSNVVKMHQDFPGTQHFSKSFACPGSSNAHNHTRMNTEQQSDASE
jgi:hypothetical protein